jgi:hypothetical protein
MVMSCRTGWNVSLQEGAPGKADVVGFFSFLGLATLLPPASPTGDDQVA